MLPLGPNKALFYKGVTSYLLPGQKSPWLVQKPKGMITDKQQMVSLNPESKQEVPMCIDPEFKQEVPVCTNPESMQEVPMCMDPEPNQEASMCTDPESKQEVPMCTDSESKPEVSQYTNPESKQKLPSGIDTEFNLEALMCTHPEFKQEDVMDMEPEIKQVTMVSESEILKASDCASPTSVHNVVIESVPTNGFDREKRTVGGCRRETS